MTSNKFSYDPAVGIAVEPLRFRKCTKQLSTLGISDSILNRDMTVS